MLFPSLKTLSVALIMTSQMFILANPAVSDGQLDNRLEKPDLVYAPSPSFPDIVRVLGDKHDLDLITDNYARDFAYRPDLPKFEAPLAQTVEEISEIYRRKFIKSGSVVLLRHNRVLHELAFEAVLRKHPLWNPPYTLDVSSDNSPATGNVISSLLINIKAVDAPLGKVVDKLNKQKGWRITLSSKLRDRHVNIFLHRCDVKQFTDALAIFLNASQLSSKDGFTIVQQSIKQEKEDEEQSYKQIGDDRYVASDALKFQLYDLLSEKQVAQLIRGEIVDIPIQVLPTKLQKEALVYVDLSWKSIGESSPNYTLSTEHNKFTLELWPVPFNGVTVIGLLTNGKEIGF